MSQSEDNYEVVNVRLDMTVYQAAEVRKILFESQKGYGLQHVPERISGVREVIRDLDSAIEDVVKDGCPPGTVMVNGECADL
jgi:hypothetical protein